MTKEEAILYLIDEDLTRTVLNKYSICYNLFIATISKPKYNLKELGSNNSARAAALSEIFPGKPGSTKACNWLLRINDHKFCPTCQTVKHFEDFNSNSSNRDGLGSECSDCHYIKLVKRQPATTAKYKAAKLQAIPKWADLKKIAEIYANCPKDYHVDHIVPLQGESVCGLHVENNLQYLPAIDNIRKSNKFMSD